MKTQNKHKRRGLAVLMAIALLLSMMGTQITFASTVGVKQLSAGWYHTMLLKTDGTLWAVGTNDSGRIGGGHYISYMSTFTQILTDVIQVSSGHGQTAALKSDGTLWMTGYNASGQLGDGSLVSSLNFKQILTDVKSVSAGMDHTLAIKTDGTLWATGRNSDYQFGADIGAYSTRFVQVLTDVKSVAAGYRHSMAIRTDNTLWVTGDNTYGQLGDGTTAQKRTFTYVMSDVKQVAAGEWHSLAVKNDGTLWVTGNNAEGQLGDGASGNISTAYKQSLTMVNQAAAGEGTSFAIRADGSLWATGRNASGQLGNGTTTEMKGFTEIMLGAKQASAGRAHAVILKTDGSVLATGYNYYGQLGDGTTIHRTSFVQSVAAPVYTPLELATNSVVEAESLQTQYSLDAARSQVVALPDGPEKDTLSLRLNAVQATIDARVAAEAALSAGTLESISIAMTLVNAMPDSEEKTALIQQLQEAQTEAEANAYPIGMDGGNVTVNAFINPAITLSMDTHVVDFNASDPTVASYEKPSVIGLTVQSNNTYSLTARALDDFKTGGASPLVMTADHLKAKASTSTDFLAISKDADAVLLQDMPNTGGSQHELDFRFDSDWQMKPGMYSTTIKIVASQL